MIIMKYKFKLHFEQNSFTIKRIWFPYFDKDVKIRIKKEYNFFNDSVDLV